MSLTLLTLALVAATNPFRALAARPPRDHTGRVVAALATTLLLTWIAAVAADPFLDLVQVTDPSARIAAGIALLVVALKDVVARPPHPEPTLEGWRGGVVPLGFPVIYSPAVALLAVAGAADRGVGFVLLGMAIAALPLALLLFLAPSVRARVAVATVGIAGAGLAAFVVLDGVYAI